MSGGPEAKLVRMANQIATFFRAYPHENAVAGVHDHIVAFWSPSMRRDLLARAGHDAAGLDPIVVEAVHRLGHGPSPTAREAAGPAEVGQMGADDAG